MLISCYGKSFVWTGNWVVKDYTHQSWTVMLMPIYRAGTGNLVVMYISYRTRLSFLEAICILNNYDDVYLVRSGLS